MKTRFIPLILAAAFSTAALAQGGYSGPGGGTAPAGGYSGPVATPATTVAQALKTADDVHVVLEGRIIEKVAKEHYTFRDDTGSIRVEIDDDDWPRGQTINEKTKVRLWGEVDRKSRGGTGEDRVKIDVDQIRILQ